MTSRDEDDIKLPIAIYLYCICLIGHTIFQICIAVEMSKHRFIEVKNNRCQTPTTTFGTLKNMWIRQISVFFFIAFVAYSEKY